jgi:uncharacterized protein involved in response to NO
MSITPILALGDPADIFRLFIAPPFLLAAFVAVLAAVVWLLCRLFGVTPNKPARDDRKTDVPDSSSDTERKRR